MNIFPKFINRTLITVTLILISTFVFGQDNNKKDSAKVIVSFIVEKNGKISNVKIEKIECEECSKKFKKNIKSEAKRVVSNMPDWKSSEQRIKYSLPIKFKYESGQ